MGETRKQGPALTPAQELHLGAATESVRAASLIGSLDGRTSVPWDGGSQSPQAPAKSSAPPARTLPGAGAGAASAERGAEMGRAAAERAAAASRARAARAKDHNDFEM